ncbi:hypothetical protein FHR74_002339 [Sphingomonas aerolata]|nr:hypothetical protein [Sphingomonas aerolata]
MVSLDFTELHTRIEAVLDAGVRGYCLSSETQLLIQYCD